MPLSRRIDQIVLFFLESGKYQKGYEACDSGDKACLKLLGVGFDVTNYLSSIVRTGISTKITDRQTLLPRGVFPSLLLLGYDK